jgi:hypothetical protein
MCSERVIAYIAIRCNRVDKLDYISIASAAIAVCAASNQVSCVIISALTDWYYVVKCELSAIFYALTAVGATHAIADVDC